jgi:ADP-heptose:LPS heptosyltransferase
MEGYAGGVRRAFDDEPRSVAIVRLRTGLGDLLCTVPALRALRRRLPNARVVLVTFAEMAPVVERMRPWVDELLEFPGHPGTPERPPREADVAPFLAQARAARFDLALQMYGANAAAEEVTATLGARRTGGFTSRGDGRPDPAAWIPYPVREHEIGRHLRLMRHLGAEPDGEALEFPVLSRDRAAAARLAARPGLRRPYALIHPGATSPARRWSPERFAAVADCLAAHGLGVALIGTREERTRTAAVARAMRHTGVDLAGCTDLGAVAALLEGAEVLVANDSGPAHLAAALGTPSVTIFLSGDPVRWSHDAARHPVVRAAVGCNPCPHLSCPIDHRCGTAVTVGQVREQIDALLAERHTMAPWISTSAAGIST